MCGIGLSGYKERCPRLENPGIINLEWKACHGIDVREGKMRGHWWRITKDIGGSEALVES